MREATTAQAAEFWATSFSLIHGRKRKKAKTLESVKLWQHLCQ